MVILDFFSPMIIIVISLTEILLNLKKIYGYRLLTDHFLGLVGFLVFATLCDMCLYRFN